MASLAPIPYGRIQDASTRRVADDTRRGMASAAIEAQRVYGTPTPVQHGPTYLARYGEMVVCAPPVAGMAVVLPRIGPDDVGRTVTVVVTTGAGAVTLRASATTGGDVATINGSASIAITGAYACRQVVAITRDAWAVLVIRDGEVVASTAKSWRYLSATAPAGAPAPSEVWQFDGTAGQLTGRIASTVLTLSASTLQQCVYGDLIGVALNPAVHYLAAPAATPAVQITGDLTLEAVLIEKAASPTPNCSIIGCGNFTRPIGTGTDCCCYELSYTGGYDTLRYGHVSSPITDATSHPICTGVPYYLAYTRAGSTIKSYTNGVHHMTSTTSARPAAVNCTASIFRIASIVNGGSANNEAQWYSVRLTAGAYTAAQVLAAWQQVYS